MKSITENSSKEEVLVGLKKNGLNLQFASEALKNDKEVVLAAVRQHGWALSFASATLKKDIDVLRTSWAAKLKGNGSLDVHEKIKNNPLFFWAVWHIKESDVYDEDRKSYINRYLLKETAKFLGAAGFAVVSGLLLGSVIALPIPTFATLIAAAIIEAISGIYAIHKLAQHTHGFFKARAEDAESSIPTLEARPT